MTRAGEKLYARPPEPTGGKRILSLILDALPVVLTVFAIVSMLL